MSSLRYGIYLYGSSARGDSRHESDTDLLVVFENGKTDEVSIQSLGDRHGLTGILHDWSLYSLSRLRKMYESGHLFAWHLFNEARFLGHGRDCLEDLGKPSLYSSYREDMGSLIDLLGSVEKELNTSGVSVIYEAGLVYLCARNIAMSASYFSPNGLTFSAFAPYELGYLDNPCPVDRCYYEKLRRARLAGTRGMDSSALDVDIVLCVANKIREWALIELDRLGCEASYEAHIF